MENKNRAKLIISSKIEEKKLKFQYLDPFCIFIQSETGVCKCNPVVKRAENVAQLRYNMMCNVQCAGGYIQGVKKNTLLWFCGFNITLERA